MSFNEYLKNVVVLAKALGYTDYGIQCFSYDIQESWSEGLTIEECVDLHFKGCKYVFV